MQLRACALRPKSVPAKLLWDLSWGAVSLVATFAPLALINLVQLPSLLLLPFSRAAFEAYNRAVAFLIWGWWAWALQHIVGVKVRVTGDVIPMREDAIVIVNHQSWSDIVVIMCLALAKGRVADTKWMVKDVIKYIPGIGWGLLFLGCVFLKREWAADRATIESTFRRYAASRLPLWLVSFPEGTRMTPAKAEASRNYARKSGLKETTHVLLPRPSGFVASVAALRERIDAVYSVAIRYPGKVPTLPQVICGAVPEVEVCMRRFPNAEIPTDAEALSAWLLGRFYEMDEGFRTSPTVLSTAAQPAL